MQRANIRPRILSHTEEKSIGLNTTYLVIGFIYRKNRFIEENTESIYDGLGRLSLAAIISLPFTRKKLFSVRVMEKKRG